MKKFAGLIVVVTVACVGGASLFIGREGRPARQRTSLSRRVTVFSVKHSTTRLRAWSTAWSWNCRITTPGEAEDTIRPMVATIERWGGLAFRPPASAPAFRLTDVGYLSLTLRADDAACRALTVSLNTGAEELPVHGAPLRGDGALVYEEADGGPGCRRFLVPFSAFSPGGRNIDKISIMNKASEPSASVITLYEVAFVPASEATDRLLRQRRPVTRPPGAPSLPHAQVNGPTAARSAAQLTPCPPKP